MIEKKCVFCDDYVGCIIKGEFDKSAIVICRKCKLRITLKDNSQSDNTYDKTTGNNFIEWFNQVILNTDKNKN